MMGYRYELFKGTFSQKGVDKELRSHNFNRS